MGTHLTKLLSAENLDCTLIDADKSRLSALDSDYDLMTIAAPPTSIKALKDAGVNGADLFIAVTPHETTNITCSVLAKALGAKKTGARIDNFVYLKEDSPRIFSEIGVDDLIYPEVLAANDIAKALRMTWVRQRYDIFNGQLVLLAI